MTPSPADLERAKRASLGQVLFRAARLYNELAIARVQRGEPRVRLAHTRLLPHLGPAGRRATDIARAAGLSKQAAGALLAELVAIGVVERSVDPSDGRAVHFRLGSRGAAATLHGLGVLAELAGELEAEVGAERLGRLHEDLSVLLAALEARTAATLRP